MLHPSYTDLMNVANSGVEDGQDKVVNSRYSIVMAAAKRARQLVKGMPATVSYDEGDKPLAVAIEEMNEGNIKITNEKDPTTL